MIHTITTTRTGDEWKQVMTCTFANSTIAELIWKDTAIVRRNHKDCLLFNQEGRAEFLRESKVITVICKREKHFSRNWEADPDTNQGSLELLADDWKLQERAWLPIMRYFQAAKEKHNQVLREWGEKHNERLAGLEHQIKELERKLEGCNGQIARLRGKFLETDKVIEDIHDCLDMDDKRMGRIERALARTGIALREHSSRVLAHLIRKRISL